MKKFIAIGLALLGLAASSPAQTVNTIVPSTSGLSEPYGLAAAVDGSALFITDGANSRIVRFDTITGKVTTLAGRTAESGSADGALLSSRFFDPTGIVLARNGLVVVDSGNYTVRFIDITNDVVTTLAGSAGVRGTTIGPAAGSRFLSPRGLAVDTNGNIFISDLSARAIRKLDTNNVVTTVASTNLSGPAGLAVAEDGRIFVADRRGHSIKLVATDGSVTKIAGSGDAGGADALNGVEAQFNLPEGALWLGSAFGLLVSDSGNHALRRVYFNGSLGVWSVETYAGKLGESGSANGAPLDARFNIPSGFASYSTGFLVVDDGNKSVRQVLISSAPPKINDPRVGYVDLVVDPNSGNLVTKFFPVTDATFSNPVIIAVVGDENVSHHYSSGAGRTNILQADPVPPPTLSSPTAPEFKEGGPPSSLPNTIATPQAILSVKAFSAAEGRTSSGIVQGTFRFQVGTPVLDTTATPGSITFKVGTTNALVYYTRDGTDPTEGAAAGNSATFGPFSTGDKLTLDIKTNTTFRARAFLANYQSSRVAVLELSPTNFAPNRISLGFVGGEASSEFVGSAGQRFMAPVTLSTLVNQKMYGLQFNLTVTNANGSSPSGAYAAGFHSTLQNALADGTLVRIDPQTFVRNDFLVETQIVATATFTNVILFTNTIPIYSNLVSTNVTGNFLGVAWLERFGKTNLYNTINQDLITFSKAHDTLFESKNQKIVVGAFSFVVPSSAVAGNQYRVQIGRPSANADGIGEDVLVEAPDGSDPNVPISANRLLSIQQRRYVVGDVAPFHWFNAGDFGDTNILNNDLEQLQQTLIYGLNSPPAGSDMMDALDSCCGDTNHVNVASSSDFAFDANSVLNTIGYGDGTLGLSDLYVTFRRALDPSLVNYVRYWSGGVRVAEVTSNLFRGLPLDEAEVIKVPPTKPKADPRMQDLDSAVHIAAGNLRGKAGDVVHVPIKAEVYGTTPVRSLLLRLSVANLDGAGPLQQSVVFHPDPSLSGGFYRGGNSSPDHYAGAWLDFAGIPAGSFTIGTLDITVPPGSGSDALYQVRVEKAEASFNGIVTFPLTSENGFVIMENRAATPWNDGIPDAWRVQYFGSLMNILSAPNGDADGDGMTNLEEYRAGTNPTDATSRLSVGSEASPIAAFALVLSWPTIEGKLYQLESAPSLFGSDWTIVQDAILGDGHLREFPISQDNAQARFYRVHIVE